MITFKDVSVMSGNKTIIENISFTINPGEKISIGGASGSGKSTILLTLMGAYKPSHGAVFFKDQELTTNNISLVRHAVAYIGQEPILGSDTVREGLLLPFTFKSNRNSLPTDKQIDTILQRLKLPPDILNRKISLISGGEKQRLAIVRALLSNKQIFVVDEITSALDEASNNIVLELFLQSDFTVLAVSHHRQWLEQFDKGIHIVDGKITEIQQRGKI